MSVGQTRAANKGQQESPHRRTTSASTATVAATDLARKGTGN